MFLAITSAVPEDAADVAAAAAAADRGRVLPDTARHGEQC